MNPAVASSLVNHLRSRESVITDAWVRAVHADPEIASAKRLTRAELADHLPSLFKDLVDYLQASGSEDRRQRIMHEARGHGNERWKQRYRLVELLRELAIVHRLLLRDGLDSFLRLHPESSADQEGARDLINQFFEDAVIGSVDQYVENFSAQLGESSQSLVEANERLMKTDTSRLTLIRTISHDLGNFLNSLTWVVEAVGLAPDESERRKMLEVTKRNLADMGSLLGELTDYSVLLAGDVKPEFEEIFVRSFCEEIKESLSPMAIASGLTLEVTSDARLENIWIDSRRLKQIVANLVSNAIKYRQRDRRDGFVRLRFEPAGEEHWQLTVADTGIGISQDDLQKVFEEFQRGPPSGEILGAGLGLAITKRLVLLLGGEISVSSEVGRGTRFVLKFSRNPPHPPFSTHSHP